MIVDVVYGFLGSGKTTFIRRTLDEWGSAEKTVVLVNEFGEVGIDGDVLASQGINIVEMPSGCICCSLQADFRSQLLEICNTIKPDRVIVEPTGVATISQIRAILDFQMFEDVIQKVHNILIVDAAGFMALYKANRYFVESQVSNAHLVILNKCDRVDKYKSTLTRNAILSLNPDITVFMSEFGKVDEKEYRFALSNVPSVRIPDKSSKAHLHAHENSHELTIFPSFQEAQVGLGFESFGKIFNDLIFDKKILEQFFLKLNEVNSGMGKIVRAKGIFTIDSDKSILMELASGEISFQSVRHSDQSKLAVIGKELNRDLIESAVLTAVK